MHMTGNTTDTPPARALRSHVSAPHASAPHAPGPRAHGPRAHGPRERGVAMLLVLIAVAMATVLSMSFLSSQTTSLGVSQNIQGHAQARSVAESALVVAINYVQSDADWRTDKSEGQWVTSASFNGGTFDLYAYDGLDTDGDGVVDDTDGDLADDDSDPVTLKVVGEVDGVTHTVFAVVTAGEESSVGNLLFIVPDASSLTNQDEVKQSLFEEWTWTVTLMSADASQAEIDSAVENNDVAYISEEVLSSHIGTKLKDATIGVVIEEQVLMDEYGFSSSNGNFSSDEIEITDNSHYITSPFSTGDIEILTAASPLTVCAGTMGAGVTTLGTRVSSSSAVLTVIDVGDDLYGGGTAAGRRVHLPWGANAFDIELLNENGETIMERSLIWAAVSASTNGTVYDYASRDQGTNIWAYDGQESSGPPSNNASPSSTLSAGEYNDIEADDSDSHSINTSSNNRHSTMRYVIEIDEDEADVSQLTVSWIGRNYNEHGSRDDGVTLYIWNYSDGSYEQLEASADTESQVTLSGTITTDITDYIGGASDDTVILLAQSSDRQSGNRDNILYCDYVSLSVSAGGGAGGDEGSPNLIVLYEFEEVTQAPVIVGQWMLDDVKDPVLYDFDNSTHGLNVWAYDGQSSTDPPNNETTPSSQLNFLEYPDIEGNDSDSHSYNTSSNNNHSMMRYVFKISEDEADVLRIDVEWVGRNYNEHGSREDGVELYIWNYDSGSYEQLDDSGDTESEVTLTGTVEANLGQYLGGASGDTITILAQSRDRQSGNRDNILYCDYVSLTLNDVLVATDSQDSNNGLVSGGVTAGEAGIGDGGTAFRFDGTSGLVTIPNDDSINFPDDFSLSGWFKLDNNFNSSTGTSQIIMSKYQSNNYDMLLVLAGNDYGHASPPDGSMVFKIEGGNSTNDTNYVWTNRTSWTAGQWYHFTAVLDSNYAPNNKIYINGVDDSGGYYNGVGSDELSLDFDADVTIGGGQADSGQLSGLRYFEGVIDDVRLVGQVLTDSQIAELASVSEPTPDTVPIAYDTSGFGVPLNLDVQVPENVTWVPGGGLTFDTATRLISPAAATKLYDALTATNQMSIEIQFTPANTSQSGPARIVSYAGGASDTNFTFGQDGNEYLTRLDTTSTTSAGTPSVDSGNMLSAGVEQHVIVSYDGENIIMYDSDGSSIELARTGDFDWDNAFDLIMGNEAVDGYSWLGTLHRVSIYDQAFDQNQADNVFGGGAPGEPGSGGAGNSVDWIEQ